MPIAHVLVLSGQVVDTVVKRLLGRSMEKYTLRTPANGVSAEFSRVLHVRCDLTKERSLCTVS
jgi:hypothetical protein